MTTSLVEKIADAVLYEGYILYPYRPSAVKNQQRWNFGALCPASYSVVQRGTESWTMQTECLVQTGAATSLDVKVRFLHLLSREVAVPISNLKSEISDFKAQSSTIKSQLSDLDSQVSDLDSQISDLKSQISDHQSVQWSAATLSSGYQIVPSLEVNGQLFQTWQEATEREVNLTPIKLSGSVEEPQLVSFSFPASKASEELRDAESGELRGRILRKQEALAGRIEVSAEAVAVGVLKIRVRILNETALENAVQRNRDEALMRSFVSTHTILKVQNGEFVSLLDPPEALRETASACANLGTYPVLVGEEGARDCLLSSPIILYDYPQIAPESPGSLYDGTEIDEILTLRIMTLTDEEKREMRGADERARQILERTEMLPSEQLMKMHGAMKGVKAVNSKS